jgi:hypothetical protein
MSTNRDFLEEMTDEQLLDAVGPAEDRPRRSSPALRLVSPEEAAEARQMAAEDQVLGAVEALERPASAYLTMPWPSLDVLVGGIAPSKLWYWLLASNNGKTLLVRSFTELKMGAGEKVFLMSTETSPSDFRLALACHALGLYPGDLLTGKYLGWDNAEQVKRDVKRVMTESGLLDGQCDLLQFPNEKNEGALNPRRIWGAAHEAADQGADWFIVDHGDYYDDIPGKSELHVSNVVHKTLNDVRKRYPFRMIVTSQMNQKPFERFGRMALMTAPLEDWVKYGGVKKENADGFLGGYRPIQSPAPDDDTIKAYKAGERGISDVAMPNAMRLKLMKHKDYGNEVGETVTLEVHKGHLREFSSLERQSMQHGIATTRRSLV